MTADPIITGLNALARQHACQLTEDVRRVVHNWRDLRTLKRRPVRSVLAAREDIRILGNLRDRWISTLP